MAANSLVANLKVLNLTNYEDWRFRVKAYLLAEGLWDVVIKDPSKGEEDDWSKKDAKALYAILSTLGDDTYYFIRSVDTTSKVAWDTLAGKLKPPEASDLDDISVHDIHLEEDRHDEGLEESNANDDIHDPDLIISMKNGDWDNAMLRLNDYVPDAFPDGVTALRTVLSSTKLNSKKKEEIGKLLVWLMKADDLIVRVRGRTALQLIITFLPQAVELVKRMYIKNNNILGSNPWPLLCKAQESEYGGKTALYLYRRLTSHENLSIARAADLICEGFKFKRFDIAWDLIQRYPKLAMAKGSKGTQTPLTQLAGMRSAFLSGSQLTFWEQWIYAGIHIKHEIGQSDQRHPNICSVNLEIFNRIHKMKLMHVRILEFLHIMCRELKGLKADELKYKIEKEWKGLGTAMFVATEQGNVEYLEHLFRANDELLTIRNKKGQTMFQFAIECRQEKIYDLIYRLTESFQIQKLTDEFNNTVLHTVGSFSPLAEIRGAALQMQRELQWFEEVKGVTGPATLQDVNRDHMTPRKLFTKNHQELVKEGEKSMKEVASSCTVVAALIVTMTFAVAFTYPGGNNEDTGLPVFLRDKAFIAFIVSDAISFFSSTTSGLIFLGVLTSRYAEDDFLKSLPTNMILGLVTLFLSIVTMMIAFSSALYIVLDGKSSIVPIILLAIVPIASFMWMQFPFLVQISKSTYGAGIFDRKVKNYD